MSKPEPDDMAFTHVLGKAVHFLLPEDEGYGFVLVVVRDDGTDRRQYMVTDGEREQVIRSLRAIANALEAGGEMPTVTRH